MSVTVLLEADVKQGKKQELLDFLTTALPDTRKFAGFINISIHSELQSNKVIFYSQWQQVSNYQNYLAWRTEKGDLNVLSQMLNSPPNIRYFEIENCV